MLETTWGVDVGFMWHASFPPFSKSAAGRYIKYSGAIFLGNFYIDGVQKLGHTMYDFDLKGLFLQIADFEWDEGNCLHLQLGHGIEPEEAEEVFANNPIFRRTKKGHYAAFGPTSEGRYLIIIFELKPKGLARPITGWDVKQKEIRYYKKSRKKK